MRVSVTFLGRRRPRAGTPSTTSPEPGHERTPPGGNMRRVVLLIMVLAVATMGVGLMAGTAGAQKAKKVTDCKKDKNLDAKITKAFNQYLGADTSAEKLKYIEDGPKIQPISDEGAAAAAAAGPTSSDTATQIFKLTA